MSSPEMSNNRAAISIITESLDSEDDYRSGSRNKSPTSLSEDYSHSDDHTRQTTDTPGFKPFAAITFKGKRH